MSVAGCTSTCGCSAQFPGEAVRKTARFIGVDPEKASALMALLREYGWELTKAPGR